jgi:hypothetical protein
MADELNPEELNYYRTRRRQVTDTYNLGQAQNVYQQGALGRAQERGVGNLAYQYGQMREKLPWGFGRRGLLNSGIYQRGLQQLAEGAYIRPLNEMTAQYQDQLGALQLAQQQLGQVHAGAISDVDEAERARIAAVAASLRGAGL